MPLKRNCPLSPFVWFIVARLQRLPVQRVFTDIMDAARSRLALRRTILKGNKHFAFGLSWMSCHTPYTIAHWGLWVMVGWWRKKGVAWLRRKWACLSSIQWFCTKTEHWMLPCCSFIFTQQNSCILILTLLHNGQVSDMDNTTPNSI